MTNLHEYLDEQENTNDDSFKVTDDSSANWALRKIKQYQEQIKSNDDLAQSEIDKINAWKDQENEKAQQSIDYFHSLLAEYAMSKRENDPKFKSMNLPNGKIGFRKRPVKWDFDKSIVDSLKKAGLTDFIRIKEEPDKVSIKKSLEVVNGKAINPNTGEVVEGITIEEQSENFYVGLSE